jgi:hypothetical protein
MVRKVGGAVEVLRGVLLERLRDPTVHDLTPDRGNVVVHRTGNQFVCEVEVAIPGLQHRMPLCHVQRLAHLGVVEARHLDQLADIDAWAQQGSPSKDFHSSHTKA